ncbi:Pre-mRNA cleavage factor Im 25 kDa subunit 2 [Smittium mucronatum]|uniref:Cleavage and polyadenylation specificity factor subunit 5 n=1 Tax=Smittium mucronatum TaxID=133383 RepID=A0A1R0GY12_9FUNG|nr:Pre-mRNA cleavage factor Im 25 kDa subunit 2 [Smittium mucronatum]
MTSINAPKINIYPLDNYAITTKESTNEDNVSVQSKLDFLKSAYEASGIVKTTEAVILVHEHNFPHVLMLQIANTYFKLPGTREISILKQDTSTIIPQEHLSESAVRNTSPNFLNETELGVFRSSLNRYLAPLVSDSSLETEPQDLDWQLGELLSVWYRPNFSTELYPYLPAHVSRPKEIIRLQLVLLPERRKLCVPRNMNLVAVPLFELYENSDRYGAQLAGLAHNLSRFEFALNK